MQTMPPTGNSWHFYSNWMRSGSLENVSLDIFPDFCLDNHLKLEILEQLFFYTKDFSNLLFYYQNIP
jgi:hypothetical protein